MATDNIFKFVSLRPPRKPSSKNSKVGFVRYDKGRKSPFHKALDQLKDDNLGMKARKMAEEYIRSEVYNPDISDEVQLAKKLFETSTPEEAREVVKKETGKNLDSFLKSRDIENKWNQLWDSLYAQSISPHIDPEGRGNIHNGIKAIEYLRAIQKSDDEMPPLIDDSKFKPVIPKEIIPKQPKDDNAASPEEKDREETLAKFNSLYEELKQMDKAASDIKNTDVGYRSVLQRKVALTDTEISDASIGAFKEFKLFDLKNPILRNIGKSAVTDTNYLIKDKTGDEEVETTSMIIPSTKPWIFDDFGQKKLKKNTQSILRNHKKEFEELESAQIISRLNIKMADKVKGFFNETTKTQQSYIVNTTGLQWIAANLPTWTNVSPTKAKPKPKPKPKSGSASARGIKPLGIGDLLVVKQELQKYTAGEVAHIENIMGTEKKNRTHLRMRETEEITITETEEIEESERDLQTTERFELQKETQKTIESEMSVEAGVSVSASYGVVTATANANFGLSQSSSESTRNATNYAKEVVDRSLSRITQKSREERTRRSLERFEEKNEHGFDNTANQDHVIGIYRWVDKHYKARVINYGKRLMMEFILPEPAAFYIHTQENKELEGINAVKPEVPTIWGRPLEPTDLTKSNYTDFIAAYNVQDSEAYPDEIVRVSSSVADAPGAGGKKNVHFAKESDKLKVPDGYQAIDFYGYSSLGGYKNKYMYLFIGGTDFSNASVYGLEGIIPMSVNGWGADYNASIAVKCELKPEGISAWQIKTFQAIMNAYENAMATYNEEVAAAEIQEGVKIEGRNPDFNRTIEQEELKKGALRMLTNNFAKTEVSGTWRYNEFFNAMKDNGQYGYPEFDIEEAQVEGKIIQFFEQAFEWANITYRFYPYYWGRKSDWDETYNKEDTDTDFSNFLRAGAARLVIPVHPSYTETVLHYMYTNEIWNGGEPPVLDDPLFISIIDEIKSETDSDLGGDLPGCSLESGYPCLSDEWDVKVPTNLVYLQEDSELPDFTEEDS